MQTLMCLINGSGKLCFGSTAKTVMRIFLYYSAKQHYRQAIYVFSNVMLFSAANKKSPSG